MRHIYAQLLTAVLVTSLFIGPCFAVEATITGHRAEVTTTTDTSHAISALIITADMPGTYIYKRSFRWGGDESTSPTSIVEQFKIVEGKQSIYIPLSAYADLGNPKHLALEVLPNREFQVIIEGGDAAGAYKAIFHFKNHEITRKKVVSGEFPRNAWEETTYTFNHLDN